MSIRVYLKSTFVPSGNYPSGNHRHTLSNRADVALHCDGGNFFFVLPTLMDPIHPEMRPHIACVTYKETFTNMMVMGKVQNGSYCHGKFLADVEHNGDGRIKMRCLTVSARAPTLPMLARWLRPLLAGEDTPRPPKTKPVTAPTIVVSISPSAN